MSHVPSVWPVGDGVRRPTAAHVEWCRERLSDRDWKIIQMVNRLRLVTGQQLDRLIFTTLHGRSREVTRGRVLRRLVAWRVLTMLPRRVGGSGRGSSHGVFALDSVGQRLMLQRQMAKARHLRVRRPGVPTDRTIRHALGVSELYAELVAASPTHGLQVPVFEAETSSWWPNGIGGYLKPDAYVVLKLGEVRDHWWIEIDLATESLPTLRKQLLAYLDFYQRGQIGPKGTMPRVLISTITTHRRDAIRALVARLPEIASRLFVVALDRDALLALLASLKE